jgi:hypothetical protein
MPLTPDELSRITRKLDEWRTIAEQNSKRSKELEATHNSGFGDGWEHAEAMRLEGKAAGYHSAMTSMQSVIEKISVKSEEQPMITPQSLVAFEQGKRAYTNPRAKGNPYSEKDENNLWNAWNEGYKDAEHQAHARQYGGD